MALRDIHVANEVEEDMPVPRSWPEYMRRSPANFQQDLLARLEPMLANTYRPLAQDYLEVSVPTPKAHKVLRPQLPPQGKASLPNLGRSHRKQVPRAQGDIPGQSNPLNVNTKPINARLLPRARPHRRGPPGLPAASFPVGPMPLANGTEDADSGSSAEVEQAINVSNASQSPSYALSNQPRSISEGLATAGAGSGAGRRTPVPIVLIQSTIADHLKQRRRGNDKASPLDLAPQPRQLPPEGNNCTSVRRTSRPQKRRRLN